MKRFLVAAVLAALIVFGGLTLGAWQTQQNFGTAGVIGPGLAVSGDIPTFNGTSGSVLQDPTNCSLTATILQCVSAGVIRLSTDTGLSRGAAGVWDVGNGTQGDVSGTVNLTLVKFSTDTGLSRGAAGVVDVGTGAAANAAGFIKSSQTLQVITSNYTTSATSLAAAGVVPGLSFTAPANVASVWSFRCDLIYSQATAAAADLFGIITSGTAPTNLQVAGSVLTSQAGVQVDNNALITTATSTTVVTATPGAFGAIGTNADMFQAHLWGTIEAPSNASPSVVGISVASGAGADALTVYRGSSCWFY